MKLKSTLKKALATYTAIRPVTDRSLVNYLQGDRQLHLGEAEEIALAVELNAERLVIDERLGRR